MYAKYNSVTTESEYEEKQCSGKIILLMGKSQPVKHISSRHKMDVILELPTKNYAHSLSDMVPLTLMKLLLLR